eukprot:m.356952 g.356952  ORF g.356952 m.356952 type:complete len:155 (-) comp17671_c0_seq1:337-801(-)
MAVFQLPLGALASAMLLGVVTMDLMHDFVGTEDPTAVQQYYQVTTAPKAPLHLAIPVGIVLCAIDMLYVLLVQRNMREAVVGLLGGYLLYLYVGIIIPSLDFFVGKELNDEGKEAMARVANGHKQLFVLLVLMIAASLWSRNKSCPAPSTKKAN